jgi:hypothetical protein
MFKMAVGHSDELDTELAAEELLAQCAEALAGAQAKAGILLASHELEGDELLSFIRAAHPDIELIGCTTLAPISSAAPLTEGGATLTLFASDVIEFGAGFGPSMSTDLVASARAAAEDAAAKSELEPRLCIVTSNVEGLDPTALATAIGDAVGDGVMVVGGGSVPELPLSSPWVGGQQFFGGEVLTDSLPVLLLFGPLKLGVGVAHGWNPVGKEGVVTRVENEVVYEIDGKPVIDFYRHYLGATDAPAPAMPLAVFDESTERLFLRAPVGFDKEKGAAIVLGTVAEGATVRVAMADTEQILEGTRTALSEARECYPEGATPEAALVVSCCTRNWLLGASAGEELKHIRSTLGDDVPVSGFYGFGEIAPLRQGAAPLFHNETCVTLLIGT